MVTGTLADMIESQYHSMGSLTEKLSAASVGVQGSGWGWLGYDKVNKRLAIATCANQVCVWGCVEVPYTVILKIIRFYHTPSDEF